MQSLLNLDRRFGPLQEDDRDLDPDFHATLMKASDKLESWQDLLKHRAVVVLGEAGTGKTTEFKLQAATLSKSGRTAFVVPAEKLATGGLDSALGSQAAQELRRWLDGSGEAFFFLDAIDEALLSRGTLADALAKLDRGIEGCFARARLFLSCRVSDFRPDEDRRELEQWLSGLPDAKTAKSSLVHVVQLMPLERPQIESLALENGVRDLPKFMTALARAGAGVIATRPADAIWLAGHWCAKGALGTLADVLASNIERKLQESPRREPRLSPERARCAFLRISGVLELSACRSLRTGTEGGPDSTSLDPYQVLSEFAPIEVSELLRRAVFDEGTYGRVRVHHRTVQEYSAAQWLRWLQERGLTDRALRDLCSVPDEHGSRHIRLHLRGMIPWVASWNAAIFAECLRLQPELLIDGGDPTGLNLEQRRSVLMAYCTRFKESSREYHSFDRVGLARFATADMVETINDLLENARAVSVERTLLLLVAAGALKPCLSACRQIAEDQSREVTVREQAVFTIGEVGQPEDRRAVLGALDQQALPRDLLCEAIDLKLRDASNIDTIVGLLQRLAGAGASRTRLSLTLRGRIVPNLDRPQKERLLARLLQMLHSCSVAEEPISEEPWGPLASELMSTLLNEAQALGPSLESVFEQAWERERPGARKSALCDLLLAHPLGRRWQFWKGVANKRDGTRRYPRRQHHRRPTWGSGQWASADAEWLTRDATSGRPVAERILAFRALVELEQVVGDPVEHRTAVSALAEKDAAFARVLERRLMGPRWTTEFDDPEIGRWKRQGRLHEIRVQRQREQDRSWMSTQLPSVRDASNQAALERLYDAGMTTSSYGELDLGKVEGEYGRDAAVALSEGLRAFLWRSDVDIPLRCEVSDGSVPSEAYLSLAGASLAVQHELLFDQLHGFAVARLARLGLWELNRLPHWFAAFERAHHETVRGVLEKEMEAELATRPNAVAPMRVLQRLRDLSADMEHAIAKAVALNLAGKDPRHPDVLEDVLILLLRRPRTEQWGTPVAARAACERLPIEDRLFRLWWSYWVQFDARSAIALLVRKLDGCDESALAAAVFAVSACMERWVTRDLDRKVDLPIQQDADSLALLIPLVWQVVSSRASPVRSGFQAVTPELTAQWFSSRLHDWLFACTPAAMSGAVDELLRDSRMHALSETLRARRENALAKAVGSPWPVERILDWERSFSSKPTTPEELFRIARQELSDFQEFVETGEFSPRALLRKGDEADLQRLLARELELRARGRYMVVREPEVANRKKPDIRLYNPAAREPVSIELKIADGRSLASLRADLAEQLVGRYLQAEGSNYGIYVVSCKGQQQTWDERTFREVLTQLEADAARLLLDPSVRGLCVIGINSGDGSEQVDRRGARDGRKTRRDGKQRDPAV